MNGASIEALQQCEADLPVPEPLQMSHREQHSLKLVMVGAMQLGAPDVLPMLGDGEAAEVDREVTGGPISRADEHAINGARFEDSGQPPTRQAGFLQPEFLQLITQLR